MLTLVASFVVVACSVGVHQAAAVLDRRDVWVALDRMGMARATMEGARARAVLAPLRLAAVGSALLGAVALFPVTGYALLVAPSTVLVVVGCIAVGIALVAASLWATRPVLSRVLATPSRV